VHHKESINQLKIMERPKTTIGKSFEHRRQPLISSRQYVFRQLRFFAYGAIIIGISLLMGVAGYCYFGQMAFVDGFYNASMILTGMGPVTPMTTDGGKIFSSFYALYSGVAFLTTAAVLLAPAIHRFLHVLNIDTDED
jgi:hypothetical protein